MANIGATTAFYKVETSLTRANNEVSKSMERLATGKQNANAGDRSSYVAMSDTFRLDYVGTKAGIKGASVVLGYLETGMRVLDSASALLSRLQELAILGANETNTASDHEAINLEAEAIADEFNRLMTTSTYKGKDVFVSATASERVALGGRGAEMSFGIGDITYTELYSTARTISFTGGPNDGSSVNLRYLPSDAVMNKPEVISALELGVTYEITDVDTVASGTALDADAIANVVAASTLTSNDQVADGAIFKVTTEDLVIAGTVGDDSFTGRALYSDEGLTFATLQKGARYKLASVGTLTDAEKEKIVDNSELTSIEQVVAGVEFTMSKSFDEDNDADGINGKTFTGQIISASDTLTHQIEAVQAKINTARVQAGSQYAALESAISYTTDLTAQYELGYNTVNDVNFSMETAHLAKNQILQQAATAMLAQANSAQQGLLQLIQG